MNSVLSEQLTCPVFRHGMEKVQDKMSLGEVRRMKAGIEHRIATLLSDFEQHTGCTVCDVGFWHNEFSEGVSRVEIRVELR
ncbi:MAG: hypothetical protein Q8J68_09375 [Methanolobus sp.]|uniref:hypothetical protein n=1 Tax=Methanolobus sp. TaxID=1874737 RepID=UPI00272F8782|nr:hypothetical protein [Methanolobus sp.]MDP2217483.1 hypothetical protein [Methanolobus sp.]